MYLFYILFHLETRFTLKGGSTCIASSTPEEAFTFQKGCGFFRRITCFAITFLKPITHLYINFVFLRSIF